MKATFLIPTCRYDMTVRLIQSWNAAPWSSDFDAIVVFLDYDPAERKHILSLIGPRLRAAYDLPRTPPFLVRVHVYERHPDVSTWVLLDDDMEFIPETNYAPAIRKAAERGVGIVGCNWIRTESPALRARAAYRDAFTAQPIVYTGGGMVFGPKVREAILSMPIRPWAFDDVHTSLCAYLAGYQNLRYLGSLAIHRTLHRGGLQRSYREQPFDPPLAEYITARPCVPVYEAGSGQNHHIPQSSDLTPLARETHRRRRALLAGI